MVDASTDIAQQLVSPIVKIGTDEAQRTMQGKPFPLVLSPAEEGINFVQLQEYFLANHDKIRQAASEYGAVMFSGFEIKSGNEWASVLFKSGIKQMQYIGGNAVRTRSGVPVAGHGECLVVGARAATVGGDGQRGLRGEAGGRCWQGRR